MFAIDEALLAIRQALAEHDTSGRPVVREGGGLLIECAPRMLSLKSQAPHTSPTAKFCERLYDELDKLGFWHINVRDTMITKLIRRTAQESCEWTLVAGK